jgi:cyanate permease
VLVFGSALGAGFAMGLALLSEYAPTGDSSARLTAMAFSVTYLTAALGPIAAGAILDGLGSWTAVFTILAMLAVAQFATIPPLRRGISIH